MNGYLRESNVELAAATQENTDSSPGEQLRRHRELSGLTPADVGIRLRLRTCIIEALENDDYQQMPKLVFARGYLRSYAKILGLPANEIVQKFEQLQLTESSTGVCSPLRNSFRKPQTREHAKLPWIMLTVAVIIFIIAGFWEPLTQRLNHTLITSSSSEKTLKSIPVNDQTITMEPTSDSTAPSVLPKLEPFKNT